ncbi:MAG: DNA double-strand break repair nuclease NurA [Thermoflexales bacterium]
MPINANALRARIEAAAAGASRDLVSRAALLDRLAALLRPGADPAPFAVDDESARANAARARFNAGESPPQTIACGAARAIPSAYALIAVDGSQILPDRHKPVMWALARAAAVCIVYGRGPDPALARALSGEPILRFWPEEELWTSGREGEPLTTGDINTERDVLERELLADRCEAAAVAGLLPIALTDGSLLPFSLLNDRAWGNRPDPRTLESFRRVSIALTRMKEAGALVAGYIERPNSAAVLKACSAVGGIVLIPPTVFDRHLYERLLGPGQRGALFDPGWRVNGPDLLGSDGNAIRAAYARLEPAASRPNIIRIEVPEWRCGAGDLVMLSAILARQTRLGGGYPFLLKAAHEEAVLTLRDQAELDIALLAAMQRHGLRVSASLKQSAKEIE